jgi:hypothetical protein
MYEIELASGNCLVLTERNLEVVVVRRRKSHSEIGCGKKVVVNLL